MVGVLFCLQVAPGLPHKGSWLRAIMEECTLGEKKTCGELYLFDRQNPVHFVEADVAGNQERVGCFKRPQPRVSARVACE